MIAFKVAVNDKQICTAGVENEGVMNVIVNWVVRSGAKTRHKNLGAVEEELYLSVGGLESIKEEHLYWQEHRAVRVGDEIRIRIAELSKVDKPKTRLKRDRAKERGSQVRYLRDMAKRLGWKIEKLKAK